MSEPATRICSRCDAQVGLTRDDAFTHAALAGHSPTHAVTAASDVTDDLIEQAEQWAEQYEDGGRTDWERVWDRLDTTELDDTGWQVDLGSEYDTPAMRKIQREVRKRLRGD